MTQPATDPPSRKPDTDPPKTPGKPPDDKQHTFFINDHRYQVDEAALTGAQLKVLDGIPAGNSLFLEQPGPDPDRRIDDAESIPLRSGLRFYDLPPIQRGHVATQDDVDAARAWYPTITVEPIPEGRWVSVGVTLPAGFTGSDPRLAVILPATFTSERPNGFWLDASITWPNGTKAPAQRQQEGRWWGQVCWQVQVWDPARENLWRYLKAMERWFVEGYQ